RPARPARGLRRTDPSRLVRLTTVRRDPHGPLDAGANATGVRALHDRKPRETAGPALPHRHPMTVRVRRFSVIGVVVALLLTLVVPTAAFAQSQPPAHNPSWWLLPDELDAPSISTAEFVLGFDPALRNRSTERPQRWN